MGSSVLKCLAQGLAGSNAVIDDRLPRVKQQMGWEGSVLAESSLVLAPQNVTSERPEVR